jgi:general secretion pathway protein A
LIYKYSGGIPRLINIACDRALLTAYGFNRRKVTGSIAGSAIKELRARGGGTQRILTKGRVFTGFLVLFCLALIAVFLFKVPSVFFPTTIEKSHPEPVKKPGPVTGTAGPFKDFLGHLTNRSSRFIAVKTAVSLWETTPVLNPYLDDMDNDTAFFQLAAAQNNFQLLSVDNDLDLIKRLNLPAVLAFLPPGALSPRYLTLIKMTENEIIFKGGEQEEIISVGPGEMKSYWSGTAYIPWKDFFKCKGDIPTYAPKESVFTLKMLLRDMGFKQIKLDYEYDDAAREAVEEIQEKHGIEVDGIVGARTKIVIYNEKKELKIPHIILRSIKN